MKRVIGVLIFVTAGLHAQTSGNPTVPQSAPIAIDRDIDSYRIYAQILSDKADVTLYDTAADVSTSSTEPCLPVPNHSVPETMNPHVVMAIPPSYLAQDYADVLQDYDLHCHDVARIAEDGPWPSGFQPRLINVEKIRELEDKDLMAFFQMHGSLLSLSEVYFNRTHTLAMVFFVCPYCGGAHWTVFQQRNKAWKQIPNWATSDIDF